ncbi:MAG: protease inhibitor I42 family protein [Dehalococcoidia bacterium]|nr:MAG: protease inhibitor I42 family protein [Dehalococcoidia bacterium]
MPAEEERVLKAKVDHPVIITLPVNKTTGFSWEIDSCDPMLKCQQLTYRRHLGGLGAGGTQRFELTALQAGEFEIRFQLKRLWETKAREVRTYRIAVSEQR